MMKKKNVAMAMAAITAASTFAPVVANAATPTYEMNSDQNSELISEIKGLLRKTYIKKGEALEKSLYEVQVTVGGVTVTADTIKEIENIENALNRAKESSTNATVRILERSKTVKDNGDITEKEVRKFEDAKQLSTSAGTLNPGSFSIDNTLKVESVEYNANTGKMEIVLKTQFDTGLLTGAGAVTTAQTIKDKLDAISVDDVEIETRTTKDTVNSTGQTIAEISRTIEVSVGDELFNISNVMLEDLTSAVALSSITVTGTTVATTAEANVKTIAEKIASIEKFESVAATEFEKEMAIVTVYADAKLEEAETSTLINNGILTAEGQELVDAIGSTYERTSGTVTSTYTVKAVQEGKITSEKTKQTTYKAVVNFTGETGNPVNHREQLAKVTFTSTDKTELENLLSVVKEKNQSTAFGDAKVVYELAGESRFETAIAISEQTTTTSDNVVLVGANAVVDGLAAGPLAAKLGTSILLTDKEEVKANVITEIERILDVENTKVSDLKKKTIYLVGGENVIGQGVVDQLEDLGVKVERVFGADRYETSMEIAELIAKKTTTSDTVSQKAFVVGGNGLADAMSISAVASTVRGTNRNVSPIIVVNKDEIDKETLETIVEDYKTIEIVGGKAAVSEEVKTQLAEELGSKKVTRVSGDTREETNAAVINKYYSSSTAKLFVANNGFVKDIAAKGDDQMIDAMTVAPLAGKVGAPIVLTGNELAEAQADILDARTASKASVTKIGGAVVNTVIEKIAKIAGLSK